MSKGKGILFNNLLKQQNEEEALQLIKNKSVKKISMEQWDLILNNGYNGLFRELVKQTIIKDSVFDEKEKASNFEYINQKFNPLGNSQIEIPHDKAFTTFVQSFTPKEFHKVLAIFRIKHTYFNKYGYLVTTAISGKEEPHLAPDEDGCSKDINIPKLCKIYFNNQSLFWEHSKEPVSIGRHLGDDKFDRNIFTIGKKEDMYINNAKQINPMHHSFMMDYGKGGNIWGISLSHYGQPVSYGGRVNIKNGKFFTKEQLPERVANRDSCTPMDDFTGHYKVHPHQAAVVYSLNKDLQAMLSYNFKNIHFVEMMYADYNGLAIVIRTEKLKEKIKEI